MQETRTCLWFPGTAEEAARLYTSLVADGRMGDITRAAEGVPHTPAGSVVTVEFSLNGQQFIALNGPDMFAFTEACSIAVTVDSQEEADRLWDALTDGGEEGQCGWLKDRYGLSWQVVPRRFLELMADPDPAVAERVVAAMIPMTRLVVADLEAAARG